MVFHSPIFIFVFVPVVLAAYFLLAKKLPSPTPSLLWLAAASLAFYAFLDIRYLPVLGISVLLNFGALRALGRLEPDNRFRVLLLGLAILANLGILAYFKYVDFFIENVNALAGTDFDYVKQLFPVGISFYTFIQIGCLIDAHNGQVSGLTFPKYLLFATFFPYVTAGPLVQQREMFGQMEESPGKRIGFQHIAVGLTLFSFGLFKKLVLADSIAPFADAMFRTAESGGNLSVLNAWLGAVAYTLQLYFDFSGYTDMALALGFMVGLRLPLNFNSPLTATSIIDFWRRWHITMTRFFTNYVYTPLATAGMRRSITRRYSGPRRLLRVVVVPVIITFAVAGLWHGPGWTFVVFGLIQGVALAVNHVWREVRTAFHLPEIPRVVAWALTILVFVVSLVFFRAGSLASAGRILGAMTGFTSNGGATPGEFYGTVLIGTVHVAPVLLWLPVLIAIALVPRSSHEVFTGHDVALQSMEREAPAADAPRRTTWRPNVAWALGVGVVLVAALAMVSENSPFLYYQF